MLESFMKIQTINPATEEVLQNYSLYKQEKVTDLIEAAHVCYQSWRKTDFKTRQQLMHTLATLLRLKSDEFATLMACEMGKPVSAGKAEILKCAWVCEHYADNAENYLASKIIKTEHHKSMVSYQPKGVVFAIMPWNYPFWQVFRFAAPTIMAGNSAILKHAPISTGSGNAIAALFIEAGFPPYLFQHFILDNALAATVIAHDKIVGVTLTGSEQAGSIVAANAASHLKKAVLELGGNDPYVILSDADLTQAAQCIVTSRLSNSGQVCIAAKRIIAVREISDELTNLIIQLVKGYQLGDPLDPTTTFGPMARQDLRSNVHRQVQDSITKGAHLLVGGVIPQRRGFYYPPTILTNVKPGMPAFDDELFGPVISIIVADDETQAIQLANQSKYGLGAAVFTRNLARGEQIATYEIDAGSCFVNGFVTSDPRLPFGGIKRSGFGRELSQEGILEFVNIKTIVINKTLTNE